MRSEASLYRGGAGHQQPGGGQGQALVGQDDRQRREEAPCLLASSERCLCFLSLFSICPAPEAFQASPNCVQGDKRADEQEISGGSGVTSHRHGGGGWVAKGGPGRVIRLTTSCPERFLRGALHMALRLLPAALEGAHDSLQLTEEETEVPKSAASLEPRLWYFHQALPTLALTSLAAQVTPGLVKAIFPLHLELANFRRFRKKERKGAARVSPTNAWGAGPAKGSLKSHSSAPGRSG